VSVDVVEPAVCVEEMVESYEKDMIEERLLGFDARERADELTTLWSADRREQFLLRANVATPLSVDVLVWPSVFDIGQGIGLPRSERERLHLAGVSLPAYTGTNVGLWEDAPRMLDYLSQRGAETRPYVVIAVSWFTGGGASGADSFGPYPARTLPATRHPSWQRLGFDVADGSLLSGLTNCGYQMEEAPALRAQWGPRLNQSHLFDTVDDALQFGSLTDARVPAHAPFRVYGLYLVDELASPAAIGEAYF
jgi:hypothetical protein